MPSHFTDDLLGDPTRADLVQRVQELEHRVQELERQNRELTALATITRSLDYRVNLQRFLTEALQETIVSLELRAGAIYLRAGDQMLMGAVVGLPADLQNALSSLGPAQTRRLLEVNDLTATEDVGQSDFLVLGKKHGIESWLAMELSLRELQAGLLLLAAAEPHRFGPHERQFARFVADQLSVAVENASLLSETRRSLGRLEAMHRASQAINSSLDLEKAFQAVAESARELTGADAAAILEWSEDAHQWELSLGVGLPAGFIDRVNELTRTCPAHENPITQAIQLAKPVEMPDSRQVTDSRLARFYVETGFLAHLAIPMVKGHHVMGSIGLWWRRPHRVPMDIIALLTTLASQSVSAIENARLSTLNERIIRNMDEGILIENAEGRILFANPRICEMLGYDSPEELIGQRLFSWIDTHDQFVARQQHHAVIAGERRRYEAKLQAKDGSVIPVLASSAPLRGYSHRPPAVLTVVTDLSEIKRLQERLVQSEKLSALGELVAGVAHELNNPLTSIIGYSQLIQANPLDPGIQEDLKRILSQAQRAAEIVRNLLAFARQERPQRTEIDLNDILQRTLALRSYELRVQNIDVVTDLASDLPATLADPYQLQQVFLNLILNAEQAITGSGVGSEIRVRTWQEGNTVQIEIADNGPGIPSPLLARIFDPFFTTKEQGKGTGLGLSICYGIIQEHHGHIWAESEGMPGKGARFRISLPLAIHKTDDGVIMLDRRPVACQRRRATRRERILLVDDEHDIIQMVGRVLQEDGYRVVTAPNGPDAVQRLREGHYDLLICDIKMPGMSGIDLWNTLVQRDPRMRSRIVFVTGDTANEHTAEFLKRSGAPALRKPFSIEKLSEFVREVLDCQAKTVRLHL